MPPTILVPLDTSGLAEHAIPYATALARRTSGRVELVLVHARLPVDTMFGPVYTDLEADVRAAHQSYIERITEAVRATGVPAAGRLVEDGHAADAIVSCCEDVEADQIVMATHGRGGLARAWLGSTTDRVIRQSHRPVLAVRPPAGAEAAAPLQDVPIHHVLLPLDGSALAEQIIDPALSVAGPGASVSLLRVVPPPFAIGSPYAPYSVRIDEEAQEEARAEAHRSLAAVRDRLEGCGVRVRRATVVSAPHVPGAILEQAELGGVDLIAAATHGHGGLRRLTLGSVTDKLLRGAHVPLLVYRPSD